MKLSQFNQLPAEQAQAALAHCVAIKRWQQAVVAARPYASLAMLYQQARLLAEGWKRQDFVQALAAHPRIGERASGEGKEAALSRQEQAAVGADAELQQALRLANDDYEQRFGHLFLIRAKGRSGQEMLAELRRRLANTPAQELEEALAQLREITLLRLEESIA
ncbi:OHCU decarboxylase [Mixta theicola]|uniref:2-oxo-4-hydroxy-4-carboxy-5-ureidoimidazoline decarboxylase n=1 Tax=Mixta theicola TaxID=1458355 RepID=A0A2K1QCM0_9GAMM|nr:2-oxo-4-hydroxy-4-carboxy-5-ureidoimidazoline decarboxylase [Mixta theicola]PNS12760.1 OHCU decarboxylase [Mixta theicola]GLR10345.1 OHCU decarboxylase [Mixta theicola]